MPMQAGDIRKSHADVSHLMDDLGYSPKWDIQDGVNKFITWYMDYYKVKLP